MSMKPDIDFLVPIELGKNYILNCTQFIDKAQAIIESTIISSSTQKYLRKKLLTLYNRSFTQATEKTELNPDYMSDIDCDINLDNVCISVITNHGIHHTLSKGIRTSYNMLEVYSDDETTSVSTDIEGGSTLELSTSSTSSDEHIGVTEESDHTIPAEEFIIADDAQEPHSCSTELHSIGESMADVQANAPPQALGSVVCETTHIKSADYRDVTISTTVDGVLTSKYVRTYNVANRHRGKQKRCSTRHIDIHSSPDDDGSQNMHEELRGHSTSNLTTTVPYTKTYRNFLDGTQGLLRLERHVHRGRVIHMHMQCAPRPPSTAQSHDLTTRSLKLREDTTRMSSVV
jgi:hypothetical protein